MTSSTQPANSHLMNIPLILLQHIVSFCDSHGTANLESTSLEAYKIGQHVWKTYVADQNLFLYATVTKTVELEKCICRIVNLYELYKTESLVQFTFKTPYPANAQTLPQAYFEKLIHNLNDFRGCSEFSELRQYILNTNHVFLTQFSPKPEQLSLTHEPENAVQAYLKSRNTDNPWRKIFEQLMARQFTFSKSQKTDSMLYPGVKFTHLPSLQATEEGLAMLNQAQVKQHSELFTLLQNYRSQQAAPTEEYHNFNHFLLLKEVNQGNPVRLRNLIIALKIDHLTINRQFSQAGLPTDPAIFDGETALKRTLKGTLRESDKMAVAKVLIDAKANVSEQGVMHYALRYSEASLVTMLIEAKADVNQLEKDKLPLEQVLCFRSVKEESTTTKSLVATLIAAKADLNGHNSKNETILMRTADRCSFEVFKFFLRQGPNVSLTDNLGQTALMRLVSTNDNLKKLKIFLNPGKLITASAERMMSEGEFKVLNEINPEIEVNRVDLEGRTAIMHSVQAEQPQMLHYVRYLLKAKADITSDQSNESPLTVAHAKGFEDVVSLLNKPQKKSSIKKEKRRKAEVAEADYITPKKSAPLSFTRHKGLAINFD
jgi:ankyrin repeat protein